MCQSKLQGSKTGISPREYDWYSPTVLAAPLMCLDQSHAQKYVMYYKRCYWGKLKDIDPYGIVKTKRIKSLLIFTHCAIFVSNICLES